MRMLQKGALLQGMLLQTLTCLGSSAGVFLCYTLLFVVRTQPWWAPQYFIPILGMMLGNSISGVSVGFSALLEDFSVGNAAARSRALSIFLLQYGGSLVHVFRRQLGVFSLIDSHNIAIR